VSAVSAADEEPAVRWRLVVAYDGAPFRGFAAQPGQPTVAGTLAAALARTFALAEPPLLTCAGRTDAGVHARGQVVHVDLPAHRSRGPAGPAALVQALNRQLAPSIVVREASPAPSSFDARRSARARRYRYLVWNAPVPDPLLAPISWHVRDQLDLRVMAAAADALVGEHDFGAFCRRPPGATPGTPVVRRVRRACWRLAPTGDEVDGGRLLRFEIEADSFCHQMVRSVVSELVAVGKGGPTVADVVAALASGDRAGLPAPAPPHGLCLVGVDYG
jgi:tRNA pseudouridine38-40 synthase